LQRRKEMTILRYNVNGITVEVCRGEIPDSFRLQNFGPIKKLELPDTKVSDEEFNNWLSRYRDAINWYDFSSSADPTTVFDHHLLEESQCD
jgi:hypothetical protein